jgi:ABC-2 type transport system ATP-binding protein
VTAVVEVEDLHKSYGQVERLHGITFEVQAGEILGFLGVNGAGKTTTIEILEGYRPRDSGRVSVLGADPARANRQWRNRIGLVLQECELDPIYTVRETVSMFARYFEHPTDVQATIDSVGLNEKSDERIGRLSGGQKRRLDVALGLVGDPEVLFLDEPTTGLDPVARHEILRELTDVMADEGRTILFSSHNTQDVEQISDRITFIDRGRIIDSMDRETYLDRWRRLRLEVPLGVELPALPGVICVRQEGRLAVATANAFVPGLANAYENTGARVQRIETMTLEEIFVANVEHSREEVGV